MSKDIFENNELHTDVVLQRSKTWFYEQVKELQGTSRVKLMREGKLYKTISPGNICFYFYHAKYEKKLPYWDAFPLVCILEPAEKGFYGVNLHYASIQTRMKVLKELRKFADMRLTKRSRMHYTWKALKEMHPILKPMTKRYLYSQMRSPFRKIDAPDWGLASMLPVADFQKVSNAHAQRMTSIKQAQG